MVVALGPGKFYGSSLPRPRFYDDVTFNTERVDPPAPVMDPLLSWAHEAHWSMGGLNFKRLRLQGRIEGNANKLRKFRERQAKSQTDKSPKRQRDLDPDGVNGKSEKNKKRAVSVSPPPAPKVTKKRKFIGLFDYESEVEKEEQMGTEKTQRSEGRKWPVRKLVGEFERVAKETEAKNKNGKVGGAKGLRTTRNGIENGSSEVGDLVMKVVEELNNEGKKLKAGNNSKNGAAGGNCGGVRTSPRLAKQKST